MRFAIKVLLLPAVVIAAACGGGGDATSPKGGNNPGGSPGTTPPTTPPITPVATSAVTVSNDQFTPASVQVPVGTTVTWTWAAGATAHNVSFADGVSSGDRGANASYSRTFSTAGTFSYVCTLHGGMQGTVLVQ
jgi:plastocyanin